MRHGETDSNNAGIALGRADVPLNATGLAQVQRLATALACEPLRAVYTSPLQRTRQTAEAIADPHGLKPAIDDRLIEMDVGEMDGLALADVRQRYPEFVAGWLGPEGHLEPMPGGESLAQVKDRAWPAILDLALTHADETISVVTHNFVILSVLATALGMDLGGFRRLKQGLAAVSLVDVTRDHAQVLRMNDTCHLE